MSKQDVFDALAGLIVRVLISQSSLVVTTRERCWSAAGLLHYLFLRRTS